MKSMENAYFRNISNELIQRIKTAQSEIKIAMAWFTNHELFNELILCLEKEINVSLIIINDYINNNELGLDFNHYINKGGKLYFSKETPLLHNKFCIIDDSLLITGSYNWTYYAEYRNLENIILTNNSDIITLYKEAYQSIINSLEIIQSYQVLSIQYLLNNHDLIDINYLVNDLYFQNQRLPKPEIIETIRQIKPNFKFKNKIKANEDIFLNQNNKIEHVNTATQHSKRKTLKSSLGIFVKENEKDCFSIILEKGISLPAKNTCSYYTKYRFQKSIMCKTLIENNGNVNLSGNWVRTLGLLSLNDIPSQLRANAKILDVTFSVDEFGNLSVRAQNIYTKNFVEATYYDNNIIG